MNLPEIWYIVDTTGSSFVVDASTANSIIAWIMKGGDVFDYFEFATISGGSVLIVRDSFNCIYEYSEEIERRNNEWYKVFKEMEDRNKLTLPWEEE